MDTVAGAGVSQMSTHASIHCGGCVFSGEESLRWVEHANEADAGVLPSHAVEHVATVEYRQSSTANVRARCGQAGFFHEPLVRVFRRILWNEFRQKV